MSVVVSCFMIILERWSHSYSPLIAPADSFSPPFLWVGEATSTLITGERLVVISATWQGFPGSFLTLMPPHSIGFVLEHPELPFENFPLNVDDESSWQRQDFCLTLQHFSSHLPSVIWIFLGLREKSDACWIIIFEFMPLVRSSSWVTGMGE